MTITARSPTWCGSRARRGGGRYSDERGWVTNPQQIQVRSNFGGSATANLTR